MSDTVQVEVDLLFAARNAIWEGYNGCLANSTPFQRATVERIEAELAALLPDPDAEAREVLTELEAKRCLMSNGTYAAVYFTDELILRIIALIRTALDKARAEKPKRPTGLTQAMIDLCDMVELRGSQSFRESFSTVQNALRNAFED